jgi:hypothetical protein
MSNDYYNHGSIPSYKSPLSSSQIRSELDNVSTGFAGVQADIEDINAALSVASGTLTLESGVSNSGGDLAEAAYCRQGKLVSLSGTISISASSSSTLLSTLPFGARPAGTLLFPAIGGDNRISINADGEILCDAAGSGVAFTLSLDGIIFAAA